MTLWYVGIGENNTNNIQTPYKKSFQFFLISDASMYSPHIIPANNNNIIG